MKESSAMAVSVLSLATAMPVALAFTVTFFAGEGDPGRVDLYPTTAGAEGLDGALERIVTARTSDGDRSHLIAQAVSTPTIRPLRHLEEAATKLAGSRREQTLWLVNILSSCLWDEAQPDLETTWSKNGDLLVEWMFSDRRLLFTLASDPSESSWTFIDLRGEEFIAEDGSIVSADIPRLVRSALT